MKNIDKIKAMSAEKMADLILDHDTVYCEDCIAYSYCKPNYIEKHGKETRCWDSIREWLNLETNWGGDNGD